MTEPLHFEANEIVDAACGASDEDACRRVLAHARDCPSCGAVLAGVTAAMAAPRPTEQASARMSARLLDALDATPQDVVHVDDADLARLAAHDEPTPREAAHLGSCAECAAAFRAATAARAAIVSAGAPATDASERMAAKVMASLDDVERVAAPAGASDEPSVEDVQLARAVAIATNIARDLAQEPTQFQSKRMERELWKAIDREGAPRRAWSMPQVAGAMAMAAVVGAGLAVLSRPDGLDAPAATPPTRTAHADVAAVVEGDVLAAEGRRREAAATYADTLARDGVELASARLSAVVRDARDDEAGAILDVVDATLAGAVNGEGMRARCELLLKHRADARAVDACRAFLAAHPAHPARATIERAAGRLAAQRLAAHATPTHDARERLLLEYTGLPSAEALLDRARCRADLGDDALARADLRLYFLLEPAAGQDALELARSLGVRAD